MPHLFQALPIPGLGTLRPAAAEWHVQFVPTKFRPAPGISRMTPSRPLVYHIPSHVNHRFLWHKLHFPAAPVGDLIAGRSSSLEAPMILPSESALGRLVTYNGGSDEPPTTGVITRVAPRRVF